MVWVHLIFHVVKAIHQASEKKAAPRPAAARSVSFSESGGAARTIYLDADWEFLDGARCVRLSLLGGRTFLTLCDPEPGTDPTRGRHDAVIEARDKTDGATFVKRIAAWLDERSPRRVFRKDAPGPFALCWSREPDQPGYERVRLHLAWRGREAEIFLRFHDAARRAWLVEADPKSRADLVAILAVALRDGAPA